MVQTQDRIRLDPHALAREMKKRLPHARTSDPHLHPERFDYAPMSVDEVLDLFVGGRGGEIDDVDGLETFLNGRAAVSLMPGFGNQTEAEIFSSMAPVRAALIERYGRTPEIALLADIALGSFFAAQVRAMVATKLMSDGRIKEASKVDRMACWARAEARAAVEALIRSRRPQVNIAVKNVNGGVQSLRIGSEE